MLISYLLAGKWKGESILKLKDGKTTREVIVETLVWNIFINQKAFGACNAAAIQLHQIFMFDATDQVNFIEEVIRPLCCIE